MRKAEKIWLSFILVTNHLFDDAAALVMLQSDKRL